jgi:hypothetical protein
MTEKLISDFLRDYQKLISKKRIYTAGLFTLFFAASIFPSCAPVTPKQPRRMLDDRMIQDFISMAQAQDAQIRSLVSIGRLTVRKGHSETELDVLMAGNRDLEKIKIEITHPWGRPVAHVSVKGRRLNILSFVEKRFYFGWLGTSDPSGFFPGTFDFDQIWTFFRAFPIVPKHERVFASDKKQITLLNSNGKPVQVVDLCDEGELPCRVFFPEQGALLLFSRFQRDEKVLYARKVELSASNIEGELGLNLKQMVFNETIPRSVFELVSPEGFQAVPLHSSHAE